MADKTFTLCFEGDAYTKKFEIELPWDGESTPDIVVVPFGGMLIKVGRYATAGDRYWYRRAAVARLQDDGLVVQPNNFTVNPKGGS